MNKLNLNQSLANYQQNVSVVFQQPLDLFQIFYLTPITTGLYIMFFCLFLNSFLLLYFNKDIKIIIVQFMNLTSLILVIFLIIYLENSYFFLITILIIMPVNIVNIVKKYIKE